MCEQICVGASICVGSLYRIGVRLLGYEVTVRPAGVVGGRERSVFVLLKGGMVRQGGEILPPQLDLYVTGLNLGQDTGSGV